MSRADDLAQAFEAANNQFIAAIERLSEEDFRKQSQDEERAVGAVAHHVAFWYPAIAARAKALGNGEILAPPNFDAINATNAQQARDNADLSRFDTANLLRSKGADAADMVRGLSDQQLTRPTKIGGDEWTAEQMIERVLIGHPRMHLVSVEGAKAGE